MVPANQIRIGIQPEAQFQVDSQPLAGSEQEPDGEFIFNLFIKWIYLIWGPSITGFADLKS